MTRDDVKLVVTILVKAYTERLMPKIDKEMIDVWHQLLFDLDKNEVIAAVIALVSESKDYPPTLGQIRGRLVEAKTMVISADEAFALIRKSISEYGIYQQDEARKWLGEDLWRVVARYGYDYFCLATYDQIPTIFAQFRRAWEGEAERKNARNCIPANITAQLDALRPKNLPPCLETETLRIESKEGCRQN